ncbi:hypothetical protein M2158_008252 [Streptomyces sp. SAI-144]|uniref:hypothetical protein n=1 Tax=Streptomyces sp. SAI-144 TaxID=2940544 RepID=UPI0024739986|nr:hypothetical protein [Streptomyces sp. SAI-144]MDH6439711.1 hypothetical protein [Streptomyces sp. SAI-144]
MRWLRHGLVWASLGVIILAARLMFPDTRKDPSDTAATAGAARHEEAPGQGHGKHVMC